MKSKVVYLSDVLGRTRGRGDAESVGQLYGHTSGVRARA